MENLAIDVIFWSISQLSRHDRESFKSFKETNLQESVLFPYISCFLYLQCEICLISY